MNFFLPNNEVKILNQGVDTAIINYSIGYNEDTFIFKDFIKLLEKNKQNAKSNKRYGVKKIQSDLDYIPKSYFLISSRGSGRFQYYFENTDFLFFCSPSLGGTVPNLRVRIRSQKLFYDGLEESIKEVEKFITKKLFKTFKRTIHQLDLFTDVWGIGYNRLDSFRFQSLMTQREYTDLMDTKDFGRFFSVQGFHFGSGDKLLRIYNKASKIIRSPKESYVSRKWIKNGYDKSINPSVFRHEFQIRRKELKSFFVKGKDELETIISKFDRIWAYGLEIVSFTNLTDEQVVKIANNEIGINGRKTMFQEAKKKHKNSFWNKLKEWNGKSFDGINFKLKKIELADLKIAEKMLKGFIGAVYQTYGSDVENIKRAVAYIQNEMIIKYGYGLHEYAQVRVATRFLKNEKIAKSTGNNKYIGFDEVYENLDGFKETIKVIDFSKEIKPIFELLKYFDVDVDVEDSELLE